MEAAIADPLFVHELALELGKTVQELTTGEPGMSAHELCVSWPAFFADKRRQEEKSQREQEQARKRI